MPASSRRLDGAVIVFDLDGTLVDTAPDLMGTLNTVLDEESLPPLPYEMAPLLVGRGAKVMLERGFAADGQPLDEPEASRLFDRYIEVYLAHIADHSRPFPGAVEAMDRLEAEGALLAICTNKRTDLSLALLDALDLSRRFAAIVGPDLAGAYKPDPAHLAYTVEAAGGRLDRALMVGDATTDTRYVVYSCTKAFVAGADIGELASVSALEGEQLARRGQRILSLIENCGKPVIACINGFALGGGCELALACTLRIASSSARLGQPEVKLGILPGYGGTQRLPRLIGKGAALKLILTAEVIGAEEALRIGLVDEVVAPDQLLARGEQIAQAIAEMAPLAVRDSIRAVNAGYDLPLAAGLELEASLFGLACSTNDKAEGARAFLEKRPPVWTGK